MPGAQVAAAWTAFLQTWHRADRGRHGRSGACLVELRFDVAVCWYARVQCEGPACVTLLFNVIGLSARRGIAIKEGAL